METIKLETIKRYNKSLLAGGLSGAVHVGGMHVLHVFFGVWYLSASVIAFAGAVVVNFMLQKHIVFRDNGATKWRQQFLLFLVQTGVYLALNTVLLYLLVSQMQVHYLLAQILVVTVLSVGNFIVYGKIFR